jgi:peptidoglycan LD-endopeptidase LytH
MKSVPSFLLGVLLFLMPGRAAAQVFHLPTANLAVQEPGREAEAFAPVPGRDWRSGMFGCVRSEGYRFHEGLDIRSLQHDRRGEPTDPVLASADGTVVYISRKPALSNYGNYVVLQHTVEGMPVYTLYAHLSSIPETVKEGQRVRAGERIAIMGRTSNTRERIGKDRAHLHFEITLFLNEAFIPWFKKNMPGARNDHGIWNGLNLTGIDPFEVFQAQNEEGAKFSLVRFIRSRPELCRVVVREKDFPFIKRYAPLVDRNPVAEREGVAGWEVTVTFNGTPVRLTPRAESELKSKSKFSVAWVNEPLLAKCPCGKLLKKAGSSWQLTRTGELLFDKLVD